MIRLGFVLALTTCAACMGMYGNHMMAGLGSVPEVWEPPAFDGDAQLGRLDDINPDPGVVEVQLEAAVTTVTYVQGTSTRAWAYNGSVPGPTLEARVGDLVIVHFVNRLPEPTTIHWHGVRLPAEMDGSTAMQNPVPPGGSFEYRFVVEDAGLFWYHPHANSARQVDRGLHGAMVVHGDDEPPIEERILVVDDVLLNRDGSEATPGFMTTMMGRQGNVLLVNGKPRPRISVDAGAPQRWRIVNVANARYFRLAIPNQRLLVIGRDSGRFEDALDEQDLLIAPGERADVVVVPSGLPSSETELRTLPYDRGTGTGRASASALLRIRYSTKPATTSALPAMRAVVPTLGTPSTTRVFRLTGGMMHMMGRGDMMRFAINGELYPDVTPVSTTLGRLERWEVVNDSEMDHPFHLHGFRFQVDGAPRGWRDTVNVPAWQTVSLLVSLDGFPGRWMFHCHILEHAENGMMAEIDVAP